MEFIKVAIRLGKPQWIITHFLPYHMKEMGKHIARCTKDYLGSLSSY